MKFQNTTRIESEGSEPDKAAFLADARLSTSSAARPSVSDHT